MAYFLLLVVSVLMLPSNYYDSKVGITYNQGMSTKTRTSPKHKNSKVSNCRDW